MILQSARIQEYIFAGMTLKESKPKQRRGFVQFCSAAPEILSTGSLWADCTRPSCKNTTQLQIWIVNLSNKAIELFLLLCRNKAHVKVWSDFQLRSCCFSDNWSVLVKRVLQSPCDNMRSNTRSPCAFAEEYK